MNTYTKAQLNCILEKHSKWRRGEDGGERADLCGANLCGANLCGADLCGADLRGADLCGANLCGANLCGADLRGADLCGANLCGADLRGADLCGANLFGADLRDADLCGANLCGADLRDADLCGANLCGADLCGADLCGAKNLTELQKARISIVPETGAFEGWKKCKYGVIVQLLIPKGSARSNATGRKCRAEFVKVLEVIGAEEGISQHDSSVRYVKGKTVKADKWEPDRWQECAGGIHFFITRAEAEAY